MLKARSLCSNAREESDDLTTATVPAGTTFPPCRGNPVVSLCALRGNHLRRPIELGSVARDGNLGLAKPIALGELGSPSLQP